MSVSADPLRGKSGGDAITLFGDINSLVDVTAYRAAVSEGTPVPAALKALLDEGRGRVQAIFESRPLAGIEAGKALTDLQDFIIAELFAMGERNFPSPHPTSSERVAVVAVGGYGRGLLAPGSDIDLLFLTPYKRTGWTESVVETVLYALWDLKQKVGQATRSINDCIRLAREDMTIRTSLLETRLVCGDVALYEEMKQRLRDELFTDTGVEFANAKLGERRSRHERAGDSRYLLEPNIKEGKGALRDLHSLFWIGKYLYQVETTEELVAHGVFTLNEDRRFQDAERFFWTVRFWLHYLAGRAQEQLTFDKQIEVAANMHFTGDGGQSGVEQFMMHYFTVAKEVGDLTRIFCAALEAQQKTPQRRGGWSFLSMFNGKEDDETLKLEHGRLLIEDAGFFRDSPIEILRLFETASRTGSTIHPATLKIIRRNLSLIDDTLRADPDANGLFLKILCDTRDPENALRFMNEVGVLGRFMPEFERIVCMMQFNMYHHYTVDEHTIRAVGNMSQIEGGKLADEAPKATEIMKKGLLNRRVLYVAMLLHDIGKGLPEDHSIVGARIAEEVCPRLGLSSAETERVVWLVRHHLLMSDTAQKRDLADVKTIRDFADIVQSRELLQMLLVLTVCDIRAVGPGVWNGWKAQLLRTLYSETQTVLSAGHAALNETRQERLQQAKDAVAERLSGWGADEVEAFVKRHYPPYWLGLDTDVHELHARMLKGAESDGLAIDVSGDEGRAATRLSLAMGDHPGLFSRITGAVSLSGASIVDARTFTTSDGLAIATLWLQDRDGEVYDDPHRLKRLRDTIAKVLRGEIKPHLAFEERKGQTIQAREENFTVPPAVNFDNTASELYTIIEVTGRDRLGLVHDLSRAIANQRISIFSAVIATYGERAVDTFYVKDMFGHKVTNQNRQKSITKALYEVLSDDAPVGSDAQKAVL